MVQLRRFLFRQTEPDEVRLYLRAHCLIDPGLFRVQGLQKDEPVSQRHERSMLSWGHALSMSNLQAD